MTTTTVVSPPSSSDGHSDDPDPSPSNAPLSALSKLSRNTSVISSSSGSSSSSLSLTPPTGAGSKDTSHAPSPRHFLHPPPNARRQPPLSLSLRPSSPRSPHGTPPTTPRGDRSPLFGVPREILPAPSPIPSQRHWSNTSADTTATIRPGSRGSVTSDRPLAGLSPRDFHFGRTLGHGSYSTVQLAFLPMEGRTYAMKVLDKAHVIKYNQQGRKVDVQTERKALARLSRPGHPGIIKLFYAMQDATNLYFVLELCSNGDMTALLQRLGSFSLVCARFYFAQLVDAVFFMHSQGVIHRDLKPDNFLLTEAWRIKITDFGAAKLIESTTDDPVALAKRSSFVGSPQYVSPEILSHQPVTPATDLWSLGIILYQLLTGHFPFDGPTNSIAHYLMWQRVLAGEYTFWEEGSWDEGAKEMVRRLLVLDPAKRAGVGEEGLRELKGLKFFEDMDWERLWTGDVPKMEAGMFRLEKRGDMALVDQEEREAEEDLGELWDKMVAGESEDEMDDVVEEEEEEGEVDDEGPKHEPEARSPSPPPPVPEEESESNSTPFPRASSSSPSNPPSPVISTFSTHPRRRPSQSPPPSSPSSSNPLESPLLASPIVTRSLLGAWTKRRELVLTSRRLAVLREGAIRLEVPLVLPDGAGPLRIEERGERGFSIHAGSKSYAFQTLADSPPSAPWIPTLRSAIAAYPSLPPIPAGAQLPPLPGVRTRTPRSQRSSSPAVSSSAGGSAWSSRRGSRSSAGRPSVGL